MINLAQLKADIDAGMFVSRSTWRQVLDQALAAQQVIDQPATQVVTVAELEEGDVIACGSPNAPLSRHALVMSKRTSPNSQYVELTTAIIGKLPAGRDRERIKVCLATDRRIKVTP